jgi:hypothetical protein
MMHRALVAVVLVALMTACGDGAKKVVAGSEPTTTTTTAAAVAPPESPTTAPVAHQDECVEEVESYDYTSDPNHVGATQGELQSDVETVRKYGEAHPDEFTIAGFDNVPDVRVVGVFTDHLDQHRDAIRPQLQHPDRFEVRKGELSARDSEAIQNTITKEWEGVFSGVGGGNIRGVVDVSLRPTKAGIDAARAIHARWSRGVCIDIAGHPYPKGSRPDPSKCSQEPRRTDRNSDVEFRLILDKTTLARGESGSGHVRITNNGSAQLTADTGSPIDASVTAPGSNDVIGVDSGAHADVGLSVRLAPGETREYPLRFGTADCRPNSDYSLPAGTYVVSTYLENFGRSDDVTITIVE